MSRPVYPICPQCGRDHVGSPCHTANSRPSLDTASPARPGPYRGSTTDPGSDTGPGLGQSDEQLLLRKLIAKLRAENATLRGAMRASDERLRVAGERVGLYFDCDNPDHMADEIEALKARIATLEEALRRAALHGLAHPKEHGLWSAREAIALLNWVEGGMVGPLPEIKDPVVLEAIAERGGL